MSNKLLDKKHLLMMRDELVQNCVKKLKLWFEDHDNEALTVEVKELENKVRDKWAAGIYIPETTIQGLTDCWSPTTPPYNAVKDARSGGALSIGKDGKITLTSFKDDGLIYCDPHKIPIIIDPTILTLNDAQIVKKAVWDIVKAEIGKQKKTIGGRNFAVPTKEPEALAAVFRCGPETFEKYLRWYDWNIEELLTCKIIALIEFHSKPEDREQKLAEHLSKKKKVRIIGPVDEEDMVRKGVGLIYQAINRKPMSARERHNPTSKKYNCPYHRWNSKKHDWDCTEDCEYLKSYWARLSRS